MKFAWTIALTIIYVISLAGAEPLTDFLLLMIIYTMVMLSNDKEVKP